jgi:uncharacterized protein YlbG (UPF0298 family)
MAFSDTSHRTQFWSKLLGEKFGNILQNVKKKKYIYIYIHTQYNI